MTSLVRLLTIAGALCAAAGTAAADATPQALPFTEDWTDTGLITVNDDWSGVPGVVGYLGGALTTSTGVDPQTVVAETTDVDVIANQSNPGISNGGVGEFELLDPVVALQGSGTADAPHLLINVDTTGVTRVRIEYDLRDLDGSGDNAIQPVALQYRVGTTGDFINVPEAFVADATTGPDLADAVTHVDVVLETIANVPHAQLRIITTNAASNDEWVGIDNISIVATASPSATGEAVPAVEAPGGPVQLLATVTPGTGPDSTGLEVKCDLTAIGGAPATDLFDDGLHGDGAAGDDVWGLGVTIDLATALGAKTIPCSVDDDQGRSRSFDVALEVVASSCGDSLVQGLEECDDGDAGGDGCDASCFVEDGWTCAGEPSVCSDIDECGAGLDTCDPNADCTNTPGGYTCACPAGWTGDGYDVGAGGTGCTDVDECVAMTDLCLAEATCDNTDGGYDCLCPAGYAGDGRSDGTGCADVDECAAMTDTCDPNADCANTPGGFTCTCTTGWMGDGATCAPICGDDLVVGTEPCDDGGTEAGDGCSATCTVEDGWTCTGSPSACTATCGDGMVVGGEECDDADLDPGDGCDAACVVEDGWLCTGEPSTCSEAARCGDGVIDDGEACDDGNDASEDGCDATCEVEHGYLCEGEPSTCVEDTDGDLIPDGEDNCPNAGNPSQSDEDGDGVGNACDPDFGIVEDEGGGCCSAQTSPGSLGGALLLALITLGGVWRRRRR